MKPKHINESRFSIKGNFSFFTKITLFSTLFLGFVYCFSSADKEKSKEIHDIQVARNIIYQELLHHINYAKHQLIYVSNQISKVGNNPIKINQILVNYKNSSNNYGYFDVVTTWNMFSWINQDGKLEVDGFEGILKEPIDLNNRDYLSLTKKNKISVFGKVIKGSVSDRSIIPIATGIFDGNNKYLSSIVFGIDIEKLVEKLDSAVKLYNIGFVMIDKNNKIIAQSQNINEDSKKLLLSCNKKEENYSVKFINNFTATGIIKLSSVVSSSDNLSIFIINDYKAFESRLFNLVINNLIIVISFVFFIILVFFAIYRKIVKPTSILLDFAKNILDGKKDDVVSGYNFDSQEFLNLYKALNSISFYISYQKVLQSKLDNMNKVLKSLIRSLSHDVKNYIYGVIGLVDVIGKNIDDKNLVKINDKNRALARIIESQSKEMLEYLQDILDKDISKNGISANIGKTRKMTSFDIKTMIETILVVNKKFAEDHQTSFILNFANNIPLLKFNKNSFRAIIDNIVNNAIKYNKICAKVFINAIYLDFKKITTDSKRNLPKKILTNYKEIKDLKGLVLIEIIDEGIGMNAQEIDLFLQGRGKEIDKTQLGREIETFGIGMNIVKDEVVRNNVIIEVESKLGEGSKIKLWFEVKNDYNEVSKELGDEYSKKQQLIKKSLDNIKFNHYNIISNGDNIHQDNKADKQNIINDDTIKNISDDDRAIIIAEDQPVIAMLLEMNLNKILKKPHIIKVSDGYDVLRTLDKIACKMIFLDNDMPNLNGMETVKMIRNQQFNNNINSKNILVIANSVNDDIDSIASFINSGANRFIDKTPTTEDLANLLKEFSDEILGKNKF
ncbi:MAG: response regulator [Rickettsiales bacterium]|nr:response regulator [Rickettsiales bacterium]